MNRKEKGYIVCNANPMKYPQYLSSIALLYLLFSL